MKKIVLCILAISIGYAFSNCENDTFSKKTLSKKLITTENKEISFKEILKKHNGKVEAPTKPEQNRDRHTAPPLLGAFTELSGRQSRFC